MCFPVPIKGYTHCLYRYLYTHTPYINILCVYKYIYKQCVYIFMVTGNFGENSSNSNLDTNSKQYGNISSRFSNNSEASSSKLPENL